MTEKLFDIGDLFDALQDIGESVQALLQGHNGNAVSSQLGLCRSEYLKAVEDKTPSVGQNESPDYAGHPFDIVNANVPSFSGKDKAVEIGCERYSALDGMGRCGAAFALVSKAMVGDHVLEHAHRVVHVARSRDEIALVRMLAGQPVADEMAGNMGRRGFSFA